MAVATYTKSGTKATTAAQLSKDVFNVLPDDHNLLKSAYVAYLANGRLNLAVTKTRGLVSGGGRKPWRQKGTGRARFGSSRNPIWRGGGIAFGPTGVENYSHKLTTQQKRQALRQALSLAAKEDKIKVIEIFETKNGRVKDTLDFLKKIDSKGNVLIVIELKDDLVNRATNNIPNVLAVNAKYLNVFNILNADSIVISKKALEIVDEWLGGDK